MTENKPYLDAIELLKKLVATPSFSTAEENTAAVIETFFQSKDIPFNRHLNNIWCMNKYFDTARPTLLLNSHHDTVKPNTQYSIDPFSPIQKDARPDDPVGREKLFGLGSNDAGGCLVALITAFCHFYEMRDLKYNLIIAATAEEEISGKNGIESILSLLPKIDVAIVGEPTLTKLAIAEKGLLVLDCISTGKAGHAAREEGENAIYKAMQDISWFQSYRFSKISESLGPVKMSVTSVNTDNKAHNVVPATCHFIVDIRVTDVYTHEEILEEIKQYVHADIKPRSMRLRSSKIDKAHPLVLAGINLGKQTYGSPTTSDAALIPAPVLKCGPGDSARSHTADEFIYLSEIEDGIHTYIKIIEQII